MEDGETRAPTQKFIQEQVRASFASISRYGWHMYVLTGHCMFFFNLVSRLRKKWNGVASNGVTVATKIVNSKAQQTYTSSPHWGALAAIEHLRGLLQGKVILARMQRSIADFLSTA